MRTALIKSHRPPHQSRRSTGVSSFIIVSRAHLRRAALVTSLLIGCRSPAQSPMTKRGHFKDKRLWRLITRRELT